MRKFARSRSLGDDFLNNFGRALRTCFTSPDPERPTPKTPAGPQLTQRDRQESIRLMRVNHAGEVSAQALYFGQAMVARDANTRDHLLLAAHEEHDHLAWCAERLTELGGHTSMLTPLWYGASFAIGVGAGLLGDQQSLGFVAETEKQVEAHLDDHLHRLSKHDNRSRAILEQMAVDEAKHGREAVAAGAQQIPFPARQIMALGGSILRQVARIL